MSEVKSPMDSDVEIQLPAVVPPNGVPTVYDPLGSVGLSWTNLPMDDPDGQRLQTLALNGTHQLLAEAVNKELDLYAVVVHPYEREDDDTGEVKSLTRMILICHDGTMYQCGGKVTEGSVGRLMKSNGIGPWHPPLKVRVESRPNKHGGRVYPLVPAVAATGRMPWQGPAKKGGKNAS